ncbi:nose resistant to fluoxetine protein 6-like [Contarinia nasturtii]|uniref:nose resistant to fluoxetine protein 6-like n=1 Tax=Contarinia nasturtii TaxID=265458 RepID=UPI0012D4B1CA|nr:nose resistant to fluoxetine protein 6-like [Contarinia nasturtii]
MLKKYARFFKCSALSLLVLVICINYSEANVQISETGLNFFDFEEIKNDFFQQSDFNISNTYRSIDLEAVAKNAKCLKQMIEIQRGLRKEMWARKIVDSWGKIPSGLLNGNFYELGEFSQCLNIDRNGKRYETQYCLGQLTFEANLGIMPKSIGFGLNHNHGFWQMGKHTNIDQRLLVPIAEKKISITFGMCLPDSCSLHLTEKILNDVILKKGYKVKVSFPDNMCQVKESPSELKKIDIAAIFVLVTFFCLIAASTCYDIICTLTNRVKTQALLIFSFYSNGMKLLSYKKSKSPDMMHCLHGIRAISTQWVVLGHTFMMFAVLPARNKIDLLTFIKQYHNMIILSAPISVDTFFFMSGLLVSINLLKHFEKTKGRINIPLLYFHRYLRLTPLLGVTFLISMSLLKFLGNGPVWPLLMTKDTSCEKYWWSALLYVQNYVNPTEMCFGYSWYLSVDMQLFVISPVIIYIVYKLKTKSMSILLILILGCIGCDLALHQKYDIKGMKSRRMDIIYYPTHVRFSPWLIGVISGYIIFEARKRSVRIPKLFNLLAWLLSLALLAAVIFLNYPLIQINSEATWLAYGLYDSLSRVAWSIALFYITFACVNNYGGPVNWFLAHPLWQPISRVCYAIYLIHYHVLTVVMGQLKAPDYFTELKAFHTFLGIYVITVFVSIIASLAFESPFMIIEKLLFTPAKHAARNNRSENTVKN